MNNSACEPVDAEGVESCIDGVNGTEQTNEKQDMLKRLLAAHESWSEVRVGYEYEGRTFDGFATIDLHDDEYVLTRKVKHQDKETQEYTFYSVVGELDEAIFADYYEFMKNQAIKIVNPGANHASSSITLAFVADAVTPEAEQSIKKASYRKVYNFGFRGYTELKFCAVDMSKHHVVSNGLSEAMQSTIGVRSGFSERTI